MAKKVSKQKKILQTNLTRRVLAYIIDTAILNLILLAPIIKQMQKIVGDNTSFTSSYQFFINNPQKISAVVILGFMLIILTIAYYSILEFKLRQTIGKMLLGIKVMSKKANFKYSQTLIRNISKPISILFIFDVIYLLVKKQNQRFFEKISDTVVIRKETKV